jgi:hypothetical protein
LPKEGKLDSRFGSCTGGNPAKDGILYHHMVVLVRSSSINELIRIGIMPYWLTTAHWQAQYPENLYCTTEMTMKSVYAMSNPTR